MNWRVSGRVVCPALAVSLHFSDQRMRGYPNADRNGVCRERMARHARHAVERDRSTRTGLDLFELVIELELRRMSRSPAQRGLPVRVRIPYAPGVPLVERIETGLAIAWAKLP